MRKGLFHARLPFKDLLYIKAHNSALALWKDSFWQIGEEPGSSSEPSFWSQISLRDGELKEIHWHVSSLVGSTEQSMQGLCPHLVNWGCYYRHPKMFPIWPGDLHLGVLQSRSAWDLGNLYTSGTITGHTRAAAVSTRRGRHTERIWDSFSKCWEMHCWSSNCNKITSKKPSAFWLQWVELCKSDLGQVILSVLLKIRFYRIPCPVFWL